MRPPARPGPLSPPSSGLVRPGRRPLRSRPDGARSPMGTDRGDRRGDGHADLVAACALSLPSREAQAAPAERPRPVVSVILSDSMSRDTRSPARSGPRSRSIWPSRPFRMTARNVDVGDVVPTRAKCWRCSTPPRTSTGPCRRSRACSRRGRAADRPRHRRAHPRPRQRQRRLAQLEQAERLLATAEAAREQARSQLIRARDTETFAEMSGPLRRRDQRRHHLPGTVGGRTASP